MNYISLKKCLAMVLFPVLSLFFLASYAQTTPITNLSGGSSNGTGNAPASNLIGGYGTNYITPPKGMTPSTPGFNFYLFTPSPSIPDNILYNLYLSNYMNPFAPPTTPPVPSLTTNSINALLTDTTSNSNNAITDAMSQNFPLNIPNIVYNFTNGKANGTAVNVFGNTTNPAQTSNMPALNLDTLLAPTQYQSGTAAANAVNFISYISDQFNPLPLIDFTSIIKNNNLTQALQLASVQQYLISARQMVANYSVGISDLNYLLYQRSPQPTTILLGNQFSSITPQVLPAALQIEASPLAIEQWMATRRLTNYTNAAGTTPSASTWQNAMENATPATLQRETVYLLAEIRYGQFQQELLDQRILATLAVQQLQNASTQQTQVQQLENEVCSTNNSLFSGACPPTPPSPAGSLTNTTTSSGGQ